MNSYHQKKLLEKLAGISIAIFHSDLLAAVSIFYGIVSKTREEEVKK